MPETHLAIGERTHLYPHGYGYCQDGCGKITRLIITEANLNGVWASYIENHEPERKAIELKRFQTEIGSPQTETHTPVSKHGPISEIPDSKGLAKEGMRKAVDPTKLKSVGYGHRPKGRKDVPLSFPSRNYVGTDKPLLDVYLELKDKHEQLLLNVDVTRLGIEGVVNWIDEIWKGSEEGKRLVIERLRTVISNLKSIRDTKK